MNSTRTLTAVIPAGLAGQRLDQALGQVFPDYSRNRLQGWIRTGSVRLDGAIVPIRHRVWGGEAVALQPTPDASTEVTPEAIPLTIAFEDDHVLVVDKPAGLVVHPAAGNWHGTLQNALLGHCPALAHIPRCGIVHRLDKDTSGLLMVAKTLEAHRQLVAQLQARSVHREYLALTHGAMTAGGTIDAAIGRHPVDRKRFAVRPDGKAAITHYRVAERFPQHTLIRVQLETGRTHQIRVHMSHIHHPLVGDPVYGGRARVPLGADEGLLHTLRDFRRQALHAACLGIVHPASGADLEWRAELPADFAKLLDALRNPAP